jgi:hypothetical protein
LENTSEEEEKRIEYIDDEGVHVLNLVDATVQEAALRARICTWPGPYTTRFEAFDSLLGDLTDFACLLWEQRRFIEALPTLRQIVFMVRNEPQTIGLAPAYMRAFAEALIRRAGIDLEAHVVRYTRLPISSDDIRDLRLAARMLDDALALPCLIEKVFYEDILCLQETLRILGIESLSLMP